MKKTKIISTIIALALSLQTIASAFGGIYPEHPQYSDMNAREALSRTGNEKTDKEHIFVVDGKKFILLDTDENGNYFVLTEDLYGKKAYDTSFEGRNGSYTVEKFNADNTQEVVYVPANEAFDINEIKFSTTDTNNIGYWLNNEFLSSGNGEGNVLPDSIKNNLITTDWAVEGMNGAVDSESSQRYDEIRGEPVGANKAKEFVIEPFTVTSKLALMSVTEFKAYQDIIGFEQNEQVWQGMMLRTPRVQMFGNTWNDGSVTWEYLKFGWANVMVRYGDGAEPKNEKMILEYNNAPYSDENFVRPCFWLDKDFFKNVACDIEFDENGDDGIGDYPLSMIKKYSYEELSGLYSDDVLRNWGYDIPKFKFGKYPEHPQYSNMEAQEALSRNGYSKTNEDYIFEVDGKKFILLDKDEEGNYFVLTEDLYGKKAYDTSFQPDTKGSNRNGSYTVEKINTSTGECVPVENAFDINEIKFSTTDTNNIGYWLNNGFLINGNGTGKILPESIKENLLMTEWAVEGMNCAVMDWTATRYDNEIKKQASGANKAKEFVIEPFTVTSKIALMSATEYKAYQDIIGFEHNEDTSKGMMLRTPRIQMFGTTWNDGNVTWEYLKFGWANVMVKNNGADKATSVNQKMVMVHNDMPHSADMFVRPCFWLDKDFFKNVKVNVENTGAVAMEEILQYSSSELAEIYTTSEIKELLGITSSWDWGHYPSHEKVPTWVGEEESASGGIKGDSPAENLFTIGGRRFILLDRNLNGEYFVMADEDYGQASLMSYNDWNALTENKGTDAKAYAVTDWMYNPAVVDSLAYKVSHKEFGLLSGDTTYAFNYFGYNGDKTKKVFPTEIVDDILLKDWEIEPFSPISLWTYNSYASDESKTEKENWLNNMDKSVHTVQANAALMSASEYDTYKNKIGFKYYDEQSTWARTLLRTTSGALAGNKTNGKWSFTPGLVQVGISENAIKASYAAANDDKSMVRPVMWLAKDFFKNNKIDVASAGATVFAEMRDLYTAEDLADTYNAREIATILDLEYVEPISNIQFTSNNETIENIANVTSITVSADFADADEDSVMIVAVYNGNMLLSVGIANTIEQEGNTKTVEVSGFSGATECKFFVWDSLETLVPKFMTSF